MVLEQYLEWGAAVLPICSDEENTVSAVNSSSRNWIVQNIWWPPLLNDCKGNHLDFDLDSKILEPPTAEKMERMG